MEVFAIWDVYGPLWGFRMDQADNSVISILQTLHTQACLWKRKLQDTINIHPIITAVIIAYLLMGESSKTW